MSIENIEKQEQISSDMSNKKVAVATKQNARPLSESSHCNCFCVSTSLGQLVLMLDEPAATTSELATSSETRLLHAARQLGRIEPLLCLLEDWLGLPLDFTPEAQPETDERQLKVSLSSALSAQEGHEVKATLLLPLASSLRRLSAPAPQLAVLMCWEAVPCQLELASITLASQQFSRLEANGMLLIPASFETFWRCQVRIAGDSSVVFSVELDANQQRLIFDLSPPHDRLAADATEKTAMNKDAARQIQIMLNDALPIPVDRLLGWAEQPILKLGQSLSGFQVSLQQSGKDLATGKLVPIGNGYGVFINKRLQIELLAPENGENTPRHSLEGGNLQ